MRPKPGGPDHERRFPERPAWIESGKLIMQYCQPQLSYDIRPTPHWNQIRSSPRSSGLCGQLSLVYQDWNDNSAYNCSTFSTSPLLQYGRSQSRKNVQPQTFRTGFPILITGLDLVDPSQYRASQVDPSKSTYPRFAEKSVQNQMARFSHRPVVVSQLRYFRELGLHRSFGCQHGRV